MVEVMSAVVYYVIPALLGRAYDLKNNTVGPDLFRVEDTKQAMTIKKYLTNCEYKMVSEMSEATDFLDVSGELSVKVKNGNLNFEGTGRYVKETKSFAKTVQIVVKCHYETKVEVLTHDIRPIADWPELVKGTGNTHYIRSILYGGDLIAALQFTCKKEEDKETIKAAIVGELNSASGSFGGGLKGALDKVQEKTGDTSSMDINYYATVPLSDEIPRTIEGLMQLVEQFPNQTKEVNDGYGVPLKMEILSLAALEKDRTTFYKTLALQDQLVILDEQMGDIQNSKQRLADWLQTMPPNLGEEANKLIGDFATLLEQISRAQSKMVANLDMSADADGEQFKPAFAAYLGDREEAIPNMYVKDLSRLKKKVLDSTPSLEADFGGSQYTHWGSETCPEETRLVFAGIMSATDHTSVGSSEYTCMPNDKQYPSDKPGEDEDIEDYPQVQQVVYISRKQGEGEKKQSIKCANCRVPGKSTTTMLPAKTECPSGWTKNYEGTLISTDFKEVRGQLICLDTSQSFEEISSNTKDLTVVTEVSPKCGNYPCGNGVSDNKALPCVVCSITKKTESMSDFLRL